MRDVIAMMEVLPIIEVLKITEVSSTNDVFATVDMAIVVGAGYDGDGVLGEPLNDLVSVKGEDEKVGGDEVDDRILVVLLNDSSEGFEELGELVEEGVDAIVMDVSDRVEEDEDEDKIGISEVEGKEAEEEVVEEDILNDIVEDIVEEDVIKEDTIEDDDVEEDCPEVLLPTSLPLPPSGGTSTSTS